LARARATQSPAANTPATTKKTVAEMVIVGTV